MAKRAKRMKTWRGWTFVGRYDDKIDLPPQLFRFKPYENYASVRLARVEVREVRKPARAAKGRKGRAKR